MAIDPRADSSERLVPPKPLPTLSRTCLKKVNDALPPFPKCPYCHKDSILVNNAEIYGRSYGEWPYAYWCPDCDAYVGLHPKTDLPLGTLADSKTRSRRKKAKNIFGEVIKQKFPLHKYKGKFKIARDAAYLWLAEKMEIDPATCHFAMFDCEMAEQARKICHEELHGPDKD